MAGQAVGRPRRSAPTTGDRRRRVIFEKRPDLSGQPYDLEDSGTVEGPFEEQFREWAAFQFLRGGEQIMGQRLAGVQPFVMTIPNSHRTRAIDPAWRAREAGGGKLINIRGVAENADDRYLLDLLCDYGTLGTVEGGQT